VLESLEHRYGGYGVARLGGPQALRDRVSEDLRSSFRLVDDLGREIEEALRKPAAPE